MYAARPDRRASSHDGHIRHDPAEAIQAATRNAAQALGRGQDVGAIAAGRFGDLVAVTGDPTRNVRLLEHVDAVIKGGELVKGPGAVERHDGHGNRTLWIAFAREPRHRRGQVRRGGDHRLVGDADRRRPLASSNSSNQLLLLWGAPGGASRPADELHPFGYGRELYFWSFVVAVLVFALGAGVSIYEGVIHIVEPEHAVSPMIAYGVLPIAFVLEGGSTMRGVQGIPRSQGRARLVRGGAAVEGPAGLHRAARKRRGDGRASWSRRSAWLSAS